MPNAQTVTVYNSDQRRSLRHLLTLCIFICFLGLIAVIMGSFTRTDFHGVPVIKVVGGVFLIVGIVLSIVSGAALIRLPSHSTQTFTAENQPNRRNGNSIQRSGVRSNSAPLTEIYLTTLPYFTDSLSSPPPPFDAPPSYEEATRQ